MALSSLLTEPRDLRRIEWIPQHNSASSHRVSRPILMSSWGALHRVFDNVLFRIVGPPRMYVVFVGGQSGPPLPSSTPTSLRSADPPVPRRTAKRAYTQLKEPTVTGSLRSVPGIVWS